MPRDEALRAAARDLLDGYIDAAIEGLLVTSWEVEKRPGNKSAGLRVQHHVIELERLLSARNGLT